MRQLVHNDVIEHKIRRVREPLRNAHVACRRATTAKAFALIAHKANAAPARLSAPEMLVQLLSALLQRLIRGHLALMLALASYLGNKTVNGLA